MRVSPMQTRSTIAFALCAVLAVAAAAAAAADELPALPYSLDALPDQDGFGLEVQFNDGTRLNLEIDQPVSFTFRAREPVHLLALYVDAGGALMLIEPGDGRLEQGRELVFPSESQDLRTAPPLGRESMIAIATERPLSVALRERARGLKQVPAADAPALVEALRAELLEVVRVDVASTSYEIVDAETPIRYTTRGIESVLAPTGTRSLRRTKLDLDILFATGSAELTPRAREDLDELVGALKLETFRARRFQLGGHTDDVGSEASNDVLSERRAAAAREYLVQQGIEEERLAARGYGETDPVAKGTDPQARRRNRRVVLEMLDER